jgi:multisubunit Na+/H+ antiporter MnhG subunit
MASSITNPQNNAAASTGVARRRLIDLWLKLIGVWQRLIGTYAEILTVVGISFAAICFLFIDNQSVGVPLGLLAVAVALPCGWVAIACAQESKEREAEQERRASATRYRVSRPRLLTLEAAGVPKDVTEALGCLSGRGSMSKEALLESLAYDRDLGWERTNEFKDVILKYMKFDERPKSALPPDTPPQPPTPPSPDGEPHTVAAP